MKKKFVSILLASCMTFSMLMTGCSSAAVSSTENVGTESASSFAESLSEEVLPTDSTASQDALPTESTAAQEAASQEAGQDAQAGSEDENANAGGGSPWIDSDLKENLAEDMAVDPKEDFHLFANKDWLLANEIPDGYAGWSHYAERDKEVQDQCIELLQDESLEGHDAELVRTYNDLLLDWDARNEAGVTELTDVYEKICSAESLDDITKLMTDEETAPYVYYFFGFGAATGLDRPDEYLVAVGTPGLLLGDSAEYSNRTELGDIKYGSRKEMFAFIAQKFGMSEEDAEKTFDDAIALEEVLATKIYTTEETYAEDYFDKINNEMTYSELISLTRVFPLDQIIGAFGYQYDGPYLAMVPDYLRLLDEIYTEDNLEAIKSLMLVKYLFPYATFLDRETYDKENEIASKYYGSSGTVSDEVWAYYEVAGALPASMQKTFIAKYGSEEDKKQMEDLCQQAIDTFREMLSENSWASDEVRDYAIEKLDNITVQIAYPDKFRDTSDLDLSGCSLIEADRRIAESETAYNRSLIGTEVDEEMWAEDIDLLSCNASYDPSQNTISMYIGMMGEPFFSSDMSVEEMYASIGAVMIGHEISHAFDSSGAQFDANGVYRDWWTKEDKEEFGRRIKKLDDYLDGIIAFGDYHLVGSNIDTEMAADITGLQCALRMASKVPDFDYKEFFEKYAQMRGGELALYSSELSALLQDPHPLSFVRTNVSVQQFDEFYEAFDVKEGDAMYLAPENRLVIW